MFFIYQKGTLDLELLENPLSGTLIATSMGAAYSDWPNWPESGFAYTSQKKWQQWTPSADDEWLERYDKMKGKQGSLLSPPPPLSLLYSVKIIQQILNYIQFHSRRPVLTMIKSANLKGHF
jgi:hypothetical protein